MQISNSPLMTNNYTQKVQSLPTISQVGAEQKTSDAMVPLAHLDDKANKILNKILMKQGLTDEKIIETKVILELEHILAKEQNYYRSEDNMEIKPEGIYNFLNNAKEQGGIVNNLKLIEQLNMLYKSDYTPLDIKA